MKDTNLYGKKTKKVLNHFKFDYQSILFLGHLILVFPEYLKADDGDGDNREGSPGLNPANDNLNHAAASDTVRCIHLLCQKYNSCKLLYV